jgi:hypothetical protein
MRKLIVSGIIATQLAALTAPAAAADLHQERVGAPNQTSAFAGARLRVSLGGGRERPQIGLAITSVRRSGASGELRFARGLELGSAGEGPIRLSVSGTPVSRLGGGRPGPEGRRMGVSTIGWVAIGVGVLAVSYLALFELCKDGQICGDDGDG